MHGIEHSPVLLAILADDGAFMLDDAAVIALGVLKTEAFHHTIRIDAQVLLLAIVEIVPEECPQCMTGELVLPISLKHTCGSIRKGQLCFRFLCAAVLNMMDMLAVNSLLQLLYT